MSFFSISIGVAIFVSIYGVMTSKAWVHGDVVPTMWILANLVWYMAKWTWQVFEWYINRDATQQAQAAPERQLQTASGGSAAPVQAGSTDLYYPTIKLDDLSGMHTLKQELAAALQGFLAYSTRTGGISDRNGILLSGPPGNGKTAFAEAIAGELGLPLIKVKGSDVQSRWANQTGEQIAELFVQAACQPCVLFFDEFETLAANRAAMPEGTPMEDRKAVTALLPAIDDARRKRIVLVAATNYVEQLDSAVMRDGRFDFRIEVPYPDYEARLGILLGLLRKFKVTTSDETVRSVARLWERRSVAFMESTVKRLRDKGAKLGAVDVVDFKEAAREASRRASAIPSTGSKLSELALPTALRQETDSLIYRLRHWEEMAERGGDPPSGVLLYGPPGTGKTNLVRALARELGDWHVFEVNATDVVRDPRKFRTLVEMAGHHRPAIVFIDEADELLRNRAESSAAGATNEILKCMDGMMGKVPEVLFMAATNNAEFMDAAALRGGRFTEKIYMGPLQGDDLHAFLEKAFASKEKVQFARDLKPRTLALRLFEATPADAQTVLSKAINYTFTAQGEARAVGMADVEKAIASMQL